MKTKLIAVASWAVFLVSAGLEYGLEIDFPLMPPVWLVIAVCALIGATAHASISSTNPSRFIISADALAKSCASPMPLKTAPAEAEFASRVRRDAAVVCGKRGGVVSAAISGPTRHADFGAFVVGRVPSLTRRDDAAGSSQTSRAVRPVIFLGAATTRGPPCAGDQSPRLFDGALDPPAPHFCAAPPFSEFHLRDSSSARNVTPAANPAASLAWRIR